MNKRSILQAQMIAVLESVASIIIRLHGRPLSGTKCEVYISAENRSRRVLTMVILPVSNMPWGHVVTTLT